MIAAEDLLELDIGNTRLKWRVRGADIVLDSGAITYFESGIALALQVLAVECSEFKVKKVLIGSVAGSDVNDLVRAWVVGMFYCEPLFAEVTKFSGGVSCAYSKVEKLGVDRWLALLAAHRLFGAGAVVVDCGSAVTVDVLVAGEHQGGYIVPGFRLLNASLFKDTSKVKAGFVAPKDFLPGQDTADCVNRGVSLMVLSLVKRVISSLSERELDLPVLFTGGDGEMVMSWLLEVGVDDRADYVADLVLDGLELAVCQALLV